MNIDKLREDLEADEGIKHETYLCSEMKLTFGVGHLVLESDPEYHQPIGTAVSPERVTECFNADIQMTIDDCRIIFEHFDGFPEEAQLCLANMCYQLGRPTFSKFKRSIAYANDHQWGDLAEEILDSRWAKQTPNRAKRISDRLSLLEVPA
jgi:lysozyme